jgi:hypothetical protein
MVGGGGGARERTHSKKEKGECGAMLFFLNVVTLLFQSLLHHVSPTSPGNTATDEV